MHVITKGNGNIINMSIRYYFTIQQSIVYAIWKTSNTLLATLACCPVDVCLGVLVILVYYTVLFYTCDRYQENELCLQRKPGLPVKQILPTEMYVQSEAWYTQWQSREDKASLQNKNLTKLMLFISCVLRVMYTWRCNMSSA